MGKMAERLNEMCIRILQLVYVNILWCLFTLLGLVVFGIGPATTAMFSILRQWVRGNTDIPIFPTFWNVYRSSFKETMLIGILYLVVGWILYVDLLYVQSFMLRALLFVASFFYLVSICYIFPIIAHYEWKSVFLKLKCSVLFGISYLQYTLFLLIVLAIVYFILFMYPGVLTFFGVSIGSYIIMWSTHQVFTKIETQAGFKETTS